MPHTHTLIAIMKNLFNFILPGIFAVSLASCSKYYINTVSSNNMLKDKTTGEFLLENDSVKITYGFGGKDAPVHVKVYNKLPVPLFVDWEKSSMVYNGKAKAFIPDEVKFAGNISTNTTALNRYPSVESTIQGSVQTQKQVTFIPPNSGIETVILSFDPEVMKLSDSLYRENDYLSTLQGTVKVKVGNFDYANSPLAFRTYLTLYTQEGQKISPFAFDKEFYVSRSVKTSGKPHSFFEYNVPTADIFFNSKTTGYGKTMLGVGVAAAVVGVAALQPEDTEK